MTCTQFFWAYFSKASKKCTMTGNDNDDVRDAGLNSRITLNIAA